MGYAGVFLLIMMLVLTGFTSLLLGWIVYKTYELKKDVNRFETDYAQVYALEEAVKKLNRALRSHDRRLDNHLHEISDIKNRLDILESGHPDTDIDYGEVDDDNAVWLDGKKYVPADKRDDDTITLYADNKVVAETTKPDAKCCATCKYYRPGAEHTCAINPLRWTSSRHVNEPISACNNYEEASKPVEYIRYDRMYRDIGGNGEVELLQKRLSSLCQLYNSSAISTATFRQILEETFGNDS
jgi:hypothetical protein